MAKAAAGVLGKRAQSREESIARLTRSAFSLMVTKGYHACTLQEIAEAAHLTKGAFFFYFESKENLLLHLLDVTERVIVDPMIQHLSEMDKPAPERIASYFRFTSKQGLDRPNELLCLIKTSIEGPSITELANRKVFEIYRRIYALLEGIIAEGKAKGEILEHIQPAEFAMLLVSTNHGMMLEWHRRPGEVDGRAFVRTVWQTFLHGIMPNAEQPSLVPQPQPVPAPKPARRSRAPKRAEAGASTTRK